jgi:hypothetical protein
MEWKHFFRPTKWKIIIAVLIPFYFTYMPLYAMNVGGSPVWWDFVVAIVPLVISIPSIIYHHFFTIYAFPLVPFLLETQLLLGTIIPILVNYLIACLAVFIARNRTFLKKGRK